MKKLSFLMLAAAMTLGFASCSNNDNPAPTPDEPQQPEEAKVVILEINVGGNKDAANKNYLYSKAITLYNNSGVPATISNWGIAIAPPLNGEATNKGYDDDGVLSYEKEKYVPALQGLWYFPGTSTIAPYSAAVISICGATDHTANGGFDLSNADFACYDPEGPYNNATYYPAPANVPSTNWLKSFRFNTASNTWPISILSPAIFLFAAPAEVTLADYFADEANQVYTNATTSAAYKGGKIPFDWIVDGVELYNLAKLSSSTKRLPAVIDAGYGLYTSNAGYSAYRNVDKEATEAIKDNAGKLVYGYDQAVEGTSDPSDINAVASAKNGAKIVYKDNNNSTEDFHLRKTWSLK